MVFAENEDISRAPPVTKAYLEQVDLTAFLWAFLFVIDFLILFCVGNFHVPSSFEMYRFACV